MGYELGVMNYEGRLGFLTRWEPFHYLEILAGKVTAHTLIMM